VHEPLPHAPEWDVIGGFSFAHPPGALRFGVDADLNYDTTRIRQYRPVLGNYAAGTYRF
jgi:hypothetical protein